MNDGWSYTSEGFRLANTAAQKKGSIHDDEAARDLGFRKAFVPGSVVGHFTMPAILERFGQDWWHAGWYDMTFVSPVYIDEEVRVLANDANGALACQVLTLDDRLCADGKAGLGDFSPNDAHPSARHPWHTEGTLADVFAHAVVGTRFEQAVAIRREDAASLLAACHDESELWEDVVPPEHLMGIALRMIDFKAVPLDGVRHPGMWAQHSIAMCEPIRWDCDYHIVETLAEKGASGRTDYMAFQFHVFDADDREVAVGRHKCKFIRKDSIHD
jgi:hypothetical protein